MLHPWQYVLSLSVQSLGELLRSYTMSVGFITVLLLTVSDWSCDASLLMSALNPIHMSSVLTAFSCNHCDVHHWVTSAMQSLSCCWSDVCRVVDISHKLWTVWTMAMRCDSFARGRHFSSLSLDLARTLAQRKAKSKVKVIQWIWVSLCTQVDFRPNACLFVSLWYHLVRHCKITSHFVSHDVTGYC